MQPCVAVNRFYRQCIERLCVHVSEIWSLFYVLWIQKQPVSYHMTLNNFGISLREPAEACFSTARKYRLTGWKVTGTNLRQLISGVVAAVVWDVTCFMRTQTLLSGPQGRFGETHAQRAPFQEKCAWVLIYWQWSLTEIPSGKNVDFSLSQKVGEQLCKLSQRIYF